MEEIFDLFLINEKGEKISSENISSHIGLAYLVIENDNELKKEFEQSGKQNPLEFFLGDKGYVAGSQIGNYYKKLIYDSNLISENAKRWIQYYHEENFETNDLAIEKEMLERGE